MSAEEWRRVPGHPTYEVSSLGRVRSPRTILKPWVSSDLGHLKVRLTLGKRMFVHRIVALAFYGDCPEGMEVRHLNGDPADNRAENLAYGTHAENMADMWEHGTAPGLRNDRCKKGHRFTEDPQPGLSRRCAICSRERLARWYDRKVGTYVECELCGRSVSALHVQRHPAHGSLRDPSGGGVMAINWDSPTWGDPATCVTIAITDDLGDHGRSCDEADL